MPPRRTTRAQRKARIAEVISTVELVENIILHMPIRDILVNATGVCVLWKASIDKCPEIQQALFFQPLPGGVVKSYTYEIEPQEESTTARSGHFWAHDDSGPAVELVRNPFYEDFTRLHGEHRRLKNEASAWQYTNREAAMDREDASWRRMLITQPPVRQIWADYMLRELMSGVISIRHRLYTRPSGIGLDDLQVRWYDVIWGFQSAEFIPKTGDEVVRIEKPRPSKGAETEQPEEPNGFDGFEGWETV